MGSNTIALLGLGADPEHPSAQACQRLVEFLAPYQAKELARLFDCSPRTAESWKRGSWPGSRHEHAIVQHWGRAWLDYVYGPLLPAEDRALAAQLAEIEGRIAAVRASVETIEGEADGTGALGRGVAPLRPPAAAAGAAPGAAAAGAGRAAGDPGPGVGGLGAGARPLALRVVLGDRETPR